MRLESAFFLLQGRSGYLNGTGEGKVSVYKVHNQNTRN